MLENNNQSRNGKASKLENICLREDPIRSEAVLKSYCDFFKLKANTKIKFFNGRTDANLQRMWRMMTVISSFCSPKKKIQKKELLFHYNIVLFTRTSHFQSLSTL